jgi:hypothetical protein
VDFSDQIGTVARPVETSSRAIEEKLHDLASKGWELAVAVGPCLPQGSDRFEHVFKRVIDRQSGK